MLSLILLQDSVIHDLQAVSGSGKGYLCALSGLFRISLSALYTIGTCGLEVSPELVHITPDI